MANTAPIRVGAYALKVRDIEQAVAFYRRALGLDLMSRDDAGAVMGTDGAALLHLEHRPNAMADDKSQAGLFHTAFVLPSRQELAAWYRHAQRIGLDVTRTGDHMVNEAIYYDDPEGNGCECYADRPAETWQWNADGTCEITTGKAVDLVTLAAEAGAAENWRPPTTMRIGHINLRVGDIRAAEGFLCDGIGLDHTGRRDIDFAGRPNTITFMSSGRYHHHVAANDFTSRGASMRNPERAGLAWFTLEVEGADRLARMRDRLGQRGAPVTTISGGFETRDPWGTRVRLMPA
jgi:catechol 2,3-dioxygenase